MLTQITDRELLAQLVERVELLEEALGMKRGEHFPREMGMSRTLERLLLMMIATPRLSYEAAYNGLYGDRRDNRQPSMNVLSAHIARCRRVLQRYGVTIQTHHSYGWEIDENNRERLKSLLQRGTA